VRRWRCNVPRVRFTAGGELDGRELLDTALHAAREAAAVHRSYLGRVTIEDWSEKGTFDFVTHVDHEAEAVIVGRIRDRFPHHAVLAEEAASERQPGSGVTMEGMRDEEWTWIIDPLDGTTNYLHRYPMYAVSIGVAQHGELMGGVVLNSATGEEWIALRGGGARRNGERIHVSEIDSLPRALIGTGFPFKEIERLPLFLEQFDRVVRNTSGVRRAGAAAIDLCHVASGYFDGFWELTLAPWDVAAGTLIIREAGGVVTRFDGDTQVLAHGSLIAGNPAIHAALAELLAASMTTQTGAHAS
jgi:myo-inositol-1(or 4)-monophosphatase